jgi:hypothetical protein
VAQRRVLGYVSSWNTVAQPVDAPYGVATGGTAISPDPVIGGVTYRVLEFTATGTLTVTKSGLFDVMLIGGGGGGGYTGSSKMGGGGGGAGITQGTVYLDANVTITIGAGGGGRRGYGSTSYIGSAVTDRGICALGGGWGGGVAPSNDPFGASSGGCGGGGLGGALPHSQFNEGLAGLQGYNGANGTGSLIYAGGGGGAGANASAQTGGAGYDVSAFIGGSTLYKAAGGGGGASGTGGSGGSGIGGTGGSSTVNGTAAAANTASGGGGSYNSDGGAGGSGIVYVRFKV